MELKSLTNQYSILILRSLGFRRSPITFKNAFFYLTLSITRLTRLSTKLINSIKINILPPALFWFHDFSGTYKGIMHTEYLDSEGKLQTIELEHVKIIYQTGNKITIHTFSKRVDQSISSFSECAQIRFGRDQYFIVHYDFFNQEKCDQQYISEGSALLSFRKEGRKKLIFGTYTSTEKQSNEFKAKSHLKKVHDFDVSKF